MILSRPLCYDKIIIKSCMTKDGNNNLSTHCTQSYTALSVSSKHMHHTPFNSTGAWQRGHGLVLAFINCSLASTHSALCCLRGSTLVGGGEGRGVIKCVGKLMDQSLIPL